MNEIIFLVQESPDGGYEAKALSAPIFTEAENLEELRRMIRDAVVCHFEESSRPRVIHLRGCILSVLPTAPNEVPARDRPD